MGRAIICKWYDFIDYIISLFKMKDVEADEAEDMVDEESDLKLEEEDSEDKIIISKRSMLYKLSSLEHIIKTFEKIFPKDYLDFSKRIETLKEEYKNSLDEYIDCYKNGKTTFEVDPDVDMKKEFEVMALERNITNFVECDLKFEIISKKIQKLCLKLSILYNTSILYSKDDDKAKAMAQIQNARKKFFDIIKELKLCSFFVSDKLKKENLLDLVSYADYLIFKCSLRNCNTVSLDELTQSIAIKLEFSGLDYMSIFKDFELEELSNLQELIEFFKEKEDYVSFLNRVQRLQNLVYESTSNTMLELFKSIFELENDVLNLLRLAGKEDMAEISLLGRFNITIDEKEVYFSIKSQACLILADEFFRTNNKNIAIVLKLLDELDDNLTYKEVYFILLLFDILDVVKSRKDITNSFVKNIIKQDEKYGVASSKEKIQKKKSIIFDMKDSEKEYVKIITANDYDIFNLSMALKNGNFDFVTLNGSIYLNSFYFSGMDNVVKCLDSKEKYSKQV